MIRVIAKRYAKALAELSEEKKIVEKTRADLRAVADAVAAQPDLQKLFVSPVFTPEDKKSVIGELAGRMKLQPETRRFIEFLAETGRIKFVREIQEVYEQLLAERQNRAMAQLATATDVGQAGLSAIKTSLEGMTGKTVDIEAKVDPALMGGVRAQIGSVVYDGTIKNQLDKMRAQLVK